MTLTIQIDYVALSQLIIALRVHARALVRSALDYRRRGHHTAFLIHLGWARETGRALNAIIARRSHE